MDRRGRIYVTVRPPGDLVQVFDTTGQSLGPIGRKGRGPGEYELPTAVAFGPRGDVLISDFGVGRLTTLSPDWHVLSEASQTVPVVTVLADGRRIGTAALRDARHIGYPLHVLDEHGRITASFGADSVVSRSGDRWALSRLASACGSRLWTMSLDHYSIDEWDSTLTKQLELVRSPDWYPHVERPDDGTLGTAPTPRAMAIHEDKHGRLWVLTRVRAKNWEAALGETEDVGGSRTYYPHRDPGRLFDTMIDVIDVHTRQLLVSQRVQGHFLAILSDEYLAAYREDADGTPLLDVWRVRLRVH
jgi:hypothetical protein